MRNPDTPSIFTLLENFTEDRPVMAEQNSDINMMLTMLTGELMELIDAVELNQGIDSIAEEAADVVILAISIIGMVDRDPETTIREKVAFNSMRYQAHLFQGDHTYEKARAISKTKFTQEDKEEIYLDT